MLAPISEARLHSELEMGRAYTDFITVDAGGHLTVEGQDICHRSHLKAYAGNGYDYILTQLLPRLRTAGLDEESIHLITIENPRRLLTGT